MGIAAQLIRRYDRNKQTQLALGLYPQSVGVGRVWASRMVRQRACAARLWNADRSTADILAILARPPARAIRRIKSGANSITRPMPAAAGLLFAIRLRL
jgi:hypothetical protein